MHKGINMLLGGMLVASIASVVTVTAMILIYNLVYSPKKKVVTIKDCVATERSEESTHEISMDQ